MSRILGIGSVTVDQVLVMDGLPEPDRKQEAVQTWHQVGGPVPVALVQAMRFGHTATFMGKWAADMNGGLIDADFAREGLALHPACQQARGRTGQASVWLDVRTASRSIAYTRTDVPPFTPTDLDVLDLASFDLLHLDGWAGETAVAAAEQVQAAGGRVVLDAGSWKPYMDVLFPLVDLVICSRQFFEPLSGHNDCGLAGSALLERGASALILTLGHEGCVFMDGSRTLHQAGFKVEALDTTGAGDVFSGAVLHALAELMAWPELLRFACAAAAHKCRANGNRDALPSLVDMGSSSG